MIAPRIRSYAARASRLSIASRVLAVAVTTLVAATACGDEAAPMRDADSGATDSRAPGDVGPVCDGIEVFLSACSGCHAPGANAARGLDLISPGVAERLVARPSTCEGRLYVDPVDVERSFLLEKLESDTPACGGSRMPLSLRAFPSATLQCIRDWVTEQATR